MVGPPRGHAHWAALGTLLQQSPQVPRTHARWLDRHHLTLASASCCASRTARPWWVAMTQSLRGRAVQSVMYPWRAAAGGTHVWPGVATLPGGSGAAGRGRGTAQAAARLAGGCRLCDRVQARAHHTQSHKVLGARARSPGGEPARLLPSVREFKWWLRRYGIHGAHLTCGRPSLIRYCITTAHL